MFLSALVFGPTFFALSAVALVVSVWAIIDAATRPSWAWEASGQNKTLWIVLNIVGLFVCGLVVGLIYLLAIRPKVATAQRGGAAPGAWGAPGAPNGWDAPGGWSAPPPGPGGWAPPPPPPPPPGGVPAGWYPDPGGSGQPRYWDGVAWADQRPAL